MLFAKKTIDVTVWFKDQYSMWAFDNGRYGCGLLNGLYDGVPTCIGGFKDGHFEIVAKIYKKKIRNLKDNVTWFNRYAKIFEQDYEAKIVGA